MCNNYFQKTIILDPSQSQFFWTTRGLLSQIAAVPNSGSSPFPLGGPWGSVVSHVLSLRAKESVHCLENLAIQEFWKMETTTVPAMGSCWLLVRDPRGSGVLYGFSILRYSVTQHWRFSRPPEQFLATPRINPSRGRNLQATSSSWDRVILTERHEGQKLPLI